MEDNYINEVSRIIYGQLKTNLLEVGAWGSKNFTAVYVDGKPGLQFEISTPRIPREGQIQILLDEGSDTYIVRSYRQDGKTIKELQEQDDVYAENLHDIINSFIEDDNSKQIIFFTK